jgi:hypothetical protein
MIPGVMVTGTSIENAEKPAFAVSSDWSVLHGLYKYQPDSGDTAYIAVALFSNGTVVMQGELYLTDSTRMDQYTYFSIKLSTTGVGNIDSGTIVFSSSSFDYAKGLNSTLYIDNVQLAHHTLSVSSPESIPLFIYPNPSAGLLRVECGLSAFSYQIYNAEGAVVLNGTDQDIDLSSLRSGIYYIQLSDGTNLSSRTKIIKL